MPLKRGEKRARLRTCLRIGHRPKEIKVNGTTYTVCRYCENLLKRSVKG